MVAVGITVVRDIGNVVYMLAAPLGTAKATRTSTGPAKLVLIVDDDRDILESYARLLERSVPNIRVHTAASPDAALAMLAGERYALIISDYRMPNMNGLDFLTRAHALQPDAVRILVSAYPDADLESRAGALVGEENFFSKAGNPEVLITRVQSGLSAA